MALLVQAWPVGPIEDPPAQYDVSVAGAGDEWRRVGILPVEWECEDMTVSFDPLRDGHSATLAEVAPTCRFASARKHHADGEGIDPKLSARA